jgi:hypothetical protein
MAISYSCPFVPMQDVWDSWWRKSLAPRDTRGAGSVTEPLSCTWLCSPTSSSQPCSFHPVEKSMERRLGVAAPWKTPWCAGSEAPCRTARGSTRATSAGRGSSAAIDHCPAVTASHVERRVVFSLYLGKGKGRSSVRKRRK